MSDANPGLTELYSICAKVQLAALKETGLNYATEEMPSVDFVTNVFERTYWETLQPGRIRAMAADHSYPFKNIVVLVNNVDDRAAVETMLMKLKANGEITAFHYIEDRLGDALKCTKIKRSEIAKTIHYTDCALVAVCLPGSPYLLYCDADVRLRVPKDWVSPGLELMAVDSRIAVVNPDWNASSLRDEAREFAAGFGIGYGFSDQLYLVRREEFAAPIYGHRTAISLRYPLGHLAPIFEERVDAYMRTHGRLRATCTCAVFLHMAEEGTTYPRGNAMEQFKRRLRSLIVLFCRRLPTNDPRFHF